MNKSRLSLACMLAVAVFGAPGFAWAQTHPILDEPGFQPKRDYLSELSFENVDTLTGNVVLTFSDLVLPGNAGRELRFQRTYNSKTREWTFGVAGMPLYLVNPAYPSPQLPEPPTYQQSTPTIFLSDGGRRSLAWYVQPNLQDSSTFHKAISSDFWIFDRTGQTRRLSFPNDGGTCDYEDDTLQYWMRVNSCRDAFDNVTDFDWSHSGQLIVTQNLSATDSREITVTFQGASRLPAEIAYDGRTWTYSWDATSGDLTEMSLPGVSEPWTFTYGENLDLDNLPISGNGDHLIHTVTTPHGGTITYEFIAKEYEGPDPQVHYYTVVLKSRGVDGTNITDPGTWTYVYDISMSGITGITTVGTPSGNQIVYHHGWADDPDSVFDGISGLVPLSYRAIQRPNGNGWEDVEVEERTYDYHKVLSWLSFGTLEIAGKTVTRDGGDPFETTYHYSGNNFDDYHNPDQIVEHNTHAGTRTTEISYVTPSSDPYLAGLPASEDVTVNSLVFSGTTGKEMAYNSNGFKISETVDGITTEFAPDPRGNVKTVTKGNGKTTLFQYKYGQVKNTYSPEYPIYREVNPDGTVAWERHASRTTTFDYDDLGRLMQTNPPGTNPTVIDYTTDIQSVTTTRGSFAITSTLDGFGRVVQTENSLGVKTTIGWTTSEPDTFEQDRDGSRLLTRSLLWTRQSSIHNVGTVMPTSATTPCGTSTHLAFINSMSRAAMGIVSVATISSVFGMALLPLAPPPTT